MATIFVIKGGGRGGGRGVHHKSGFSKMLRLHRLSLCYKNTISKFTLVPF